MLKNIISIYENAVFYTSQPKTISDKIWMFFDPIAEEWIGIPKEDLSNKELQLLSALYERVEVAINQPSTLIESQWYGFLYKNEAPPPYPKETAFRFIQFQIKGEISSQAEMEDALEGFFSEDVVIVWENLHKGVIIEEKNQISLNEEELISMSKTLESDLYVTITFYIGKLNPFSSDLSCRFQKEKDYFLFGLTHLETPNIFTFEKVFPPFLGYRIPKNLQDEIIKELGGIFQEDPEMFATIKVFLENNLNASLTAKKLYIHRNTLQYRIDKFTEKTGIGLKDFYGAFTVYLACLLYEIHK